MIPNQQTWAVLILTLVLLVGCGKEEPSPELVVYGQVPSFSLTNQHGASFTEASMHGHVSIANFIFTRCPTICPVFTMKMQRVAEQTGDSIELLSFSVDPEYDTPERLLAYAEERGIKDKRWHFLTGDASKMLSLVEGSLKISMDQQGAGENGIPDIVHGSHFVLFDSEAQIRGYYNSDDQTRIATMIQDAKRLSR